jgi:hypothetical protein
MLPASGSVTVEGTAGGRSRPSGVLRCGSVWACPACASRKREQKAGQIDKALVEWDRRGGGATLVTLTVPHNRAMTCDEALALVADGYRQLMAGRFGQALKADLGWFGAVKALEVTHGESGWHAHAHVIVLHDREADRVQLLGRLHLRWSHIMGKLTGERIAAQAVDVRPVNIEHGLLGGYLGKVADGWGAGLELARGDVKAGRGGSRSPVQLLDAAVAGDPGALDLWQEYELATKGRHAIQWTKGTVEALGVTEQEDEAVADPDDEVVYRREVAAAVWHALVDLGRDVDYLEAVEDWLADGGDEPDPVTFVRMGSTAGDSTSSAPSAP